MVRLYLAAPYAGRDILKGQLEAWRELGAEITCGWVKGTRPLGAATYGISSESTQQEVAAHAEMDLEDIEIADAVIHYTANYLRYLDPSLGDVTHQLHTGGRHVETGYAIAKEVPVVVLGDYENIFQRGLCPQAYTLVEAMRIVRSALDLQEA